MTPRLLQAMAGQAHGGAEAFFTRLALALEASGQEQRVAVRADPARTAKLRDAGITVTELPFGGSFDLRTRLGLKRLIGGWRPQIVLSWMSRAARAVPKGDFVHIGRLGGYYDLKYYAACNHLIGNTRDIVNHLVAAGWPASRTHYLPNFVDETAMPPVSRPDLATPPDASVLLALGRLHPNKGFDVLIEAMAALPGIHLWLAGEGAERADLERRASHADIAGRVHFLGWRDDVPALLAAADILVCPSRHEPLGNVILEAWAHGVPVVAASSQGPRQLIEPGETGLLVPIDDARALAREIAALLAAPERRAAVAAAARQRFAAEFSKAAVVAAYRGLFESVSR